jgi:hypothetical protein
MDMHPVNSSNIHSIGHDPSTNTMHVKFKNGALYEYHNVSATEHHNIKHAGSPGSALRSTVAGKHYHKIGG